MSLSKQPAFDALLALEKKYGANALKVAIRAFLKAGDRAGVKPTPRKRIPRSWVLEALDRQGGLCSICKEPLHINDASGEHVRSLALGGAHNRFNVKAAHGRCNSGKGARSEMEQAKKTSRLLTEVI